MTVDDKKPEAHALAVAGGKIAAVGREAEVMALKGPATKMVDLQGKTLAPGFVDGHCHLLGFGAQAVGANLLASLDGEVNAVEDLVKSLQAFANGPDVQRTGWRFGVGYDDALLGRHPDRDDLDKVSKDIPVIAIHISGHFSAMNSAGLKKAGYSAASQDPEGGIIRRRPGSKEPNGMLEELASFLPVIAAITPSRPEDKDFLLKKALELAKSFGYTTANEGRAFAARHTDMAAQAQRGLFDIGVMAYIDYSDRKVITPEWFDPSYKNRCRIAGMKITLDGSPQGRTAWRTIPYLIPPEGQKSGYNGYPAIPDTKVVENLFDNAYRNKWPVKVHANADAAIDQMIAAIRPVHRKYGPGDRRHVLIHGQLIRQDQIDSLKELQIFPSLFPMHTSYWGDWYGKIIGPELAQQISPMRSVLNRGMIATSHTDAPVALPNLMQVMWATVNRVSRSGKFIGEKERLTPIGALKSITLWGAYQHFEEKTKESLAAGKLADMAILSNNPTTIDPTQINKIQVLESIKEGTTVYRRAL